MEATVVPSGKASLPIVVGGSNSSTYPGGGIPYPLAGMGDGLALVFGVTVPEDGGGGMSVLSTRVVFFLGTGAAVSW